MSTFRVLRFLCTPGEAWIRLMARLCGSRAVVSDGAPRPVALTPRVALSPDRRRMRIAMNEEFIVLEKPAATTLGADLGRAIAEMRA